MSTARDGAAAAATGAVPPPRPTVVCDNERSGSADLLDPPDVDSILDKRRNPWRAYLRLHLPRSVQTPLTCLCICISALQANGVYVWPTYGPEVSRRLELDGTESQTIVVGGILGVYLMAAPLGSVCDRYGPRIASLTSAALGAIGYLSFAAMLKNFTPATPYAYLYLTAAYFCVGSATVGSYFACLTCASLSFPSHPTLALSVPLSLMGLSSLAISSVSTLSPFITSRPDTSVPEFAATKFLVFLGIACPLVNIFSAIFMRIVPDETVPDMYITGGNDGTAAGPRGYGATAEQDPMSASMYSTRSKRSISKGGPRGAHGRSTSRVSQSSRRSLLSRAAQIREARLQNPDDPEAADPLVRDEDSVPDEDAIPPPSPISQLLHLDEHTPLLIGGPEAAREEVEAMIRGKEIRLTAVKLVKNFEGFWVFGFVLALCIGPAETIMASVGSMLTSLLPPPSTAVLGPGATLTPILSVFGGTAPLVGAQVATADAPNPLALRNKHVMILSLTGTIARLLVGITADLLCPPPTAVPAPPSDDPDAPAHVFVQKKRIWLRRSSFAVLAIVALAAVCAYAAGVLQSEEGLWVVSAGTGSLYGTIFTLTPAIISAHFGPTNFGLAWGMVSYFAALGAVLFSYLYAYLSTMMATRKAPAVLFGVLTSAAVTAGDSVLSTLKKGGAEPPICYGARCFQTTMWVSGACCLVSAVGFFILGRRWKV